MKRLVVGACVAAFIALPAPGRSASAALEMRSLPMHFEMRQGPSDACGTNCRIWVAASGAITADSARDFETFAKTNDIRGATLVLDSDGGSVLGALALGRAIRRLSMVTTVGRLVDLDASDNGVTRARLVPQAYCESMCAFVLLAGVKRYVPAGAQVLVHQIWLGDRRDDPTAANYSAEDLVLVQRDIGRLAQYTVEMGGGIDLLETALKIPPWEPMRQLSRDELRGMNIITADRQQVATVAVASTAAPALANGHRITTGERSWIIADKSGGVLLTRRHPLTVEGDEIGHFELSIGCNGPANGYTVSYIEHRRGAGTDGTREVLSSVEVTLLGTTIPLKVVSSNLSGKPTVLDTAARGTIPEGLVKGFADLNSRSITVQTTNADVLTNIRIGNVGAARNFQRLADACTAMSPVRSTALHPATLAADQPR